MSYWDKALEEVRKIEDQKFLRRLVREFVRKELNEVGGMGSGNSTADGDSPEPESEVEGTY